MAEIVKYVLVDKNDIEGDEEHDTLHDAMICANLGASIQGNFAIIARTYEYTDSELVWTPDGAHTWPPSSGEGS